MTDTERIDKIETELKLTRKINHCLFAVMLGALAIITVGAASGPEKSAEIRATKFILEDQAGQERGIFSANEKGAELKLIGTGGKPQCVIFTDDAGAGLSLADANGKERIGLRARANILQLVFSGANEKKLLQLEARDDHPGLVMADAGGMDRIMLKIENTDPVVAITDVNGKQRIRLGMRDDFPNLTLSGAGGEPFWAAIPDKYNEKVFNK